jgi:hypothetical protein
MISQALAVGVSKASGLSDRNITVTTAIDKYVSYHMAWCVLRLRMEVTITEFCGYLLHILNRKAHTHQGGGLESKNFSF